MRETSTSGWSVHNSSDAWLRGVRMAAVVVGIGLVMSAGIARAQDEEEDDNASFSDKIIRNVMTGIGGTNMENRGIDYRERSPLVVPPKIDLPPPEAAAAESKAANWPKDPDVQRRKAAAAGDKSIEPMNSGKEAARALTPAEMAPKRVRTSRSAETDRPGDPGRNIMMSPTQLGVNTGLFKTMFGGSTATETAPFKGEPSRESLTQPPTGYQTPSPNFAYGTGTKEVMKQADPVNGKY